VKSPSIILETAVEREKAVQDIYVHREFKKLVVTLWVMRHFFILQGAPRACVDFCDPTAVFRIIVLVATFDVFDSTTVFEKNPKMDSR
jgi:hypothetical protein